MKERISLYFILITCNLFFSCTNNKQGNMECKNLDKELGLPMFIILDNNAINNDNKQLETLYKMISDNKKDISFIMSLKKDLILSFKKAETDSLLFSLFQTDSFETYQKLITRSFSEANELINKWENEKLTTVDKQQLKFLLFKRQFLYKIIWDSWFFDSLFMEYNTGVLSDSGKKILSEYYDHGSFLQFNNNIINKFLSEEYLEEALIVIDVKYYEKMVLDKDNYSGACQKLYEFYYNLYSNNPNYTIAIYNI